MSKNYEYRQINSRFIFSDIDYQRAIKMPEVKKILSEFDEYIVNAIKVSYRADTNKYYVFDGQHTLAALKLRNNNKDLLVDCKVYTGLTKEDEARLFAKQNGISRNVTLAQKFKALHVSGDVHIVNFKETTESAGIEINFTKGDKIQAYKKAIEIFEKMGSQKYTNMLEVIEEAWGKSSKTFSARILGGMYEFYNSYYGQFDKNTLINQLSKVSTVFIEREGKLSSNSGDKKFARQILIAYNKNLRKNRLEDKLN